MQTTRYGLKSLPTYYKGITFRSRLEARWAMILDRRGIQWEYEAEAFEIDGRHFGDPYNPGTFSYLPDFYLPEYDSFLEVKGKLDEAEYWRLMRIVYNITGTASWWPAKTLYGKPFFLAGNLGMEGQNPKIISLFHYKGDIKANFQKTDFDYAFDRCTHNYVGQDSYDPEFKPDAGQFGNMSINQICHHLCNNFFDEEYDHGFALAVSRARSARFENGHYV